MRLFSKRDRLQRRGVADLGVPPFPPDGPPPEEVRVPVPDDPAAAYARLGVDLPGEVAPVGEPRPGVPVWAVRPGEQAALDWWERLRDLHPRTGLWPMLFWWGDVPVADASVWEHTALGEYADEVVDVTETFDAGAWLSAHDEQDIVGLAKMPRSTLPPPDPRPADWRACFSETFRGYMPDAVAVIPAAGGWAVPAVLSWWGGVNSHVDPTAHSAVLRRWTSAWGTELLTLEGDTMVLRAGRTPTDDLTLLRLAAEATVHCPYSCDLWGGPLEDRAHMLRRPIWAFWWD
jgi:hypothetical protein